MRKILLVLALLFATPLYAQPVGGGIITATSADCSTNQSCVQFSMPSSPSVAFQITGTFVGTLTFEISADGATFTAASVVNMASGTSVTTTTAPGIFALTNLGIVRLRARASAWTSGQANVTLVQGYASAKSGGGGGAVAGGACAAGLVATSVTAGTGAPGCVAILTDPAPVGSQDLFTIGYVGNTTLFRVFADTNPNDDAVRVNGSISFGASGTAFSVSSPANNYGGFFSFGTNNEIANDLVAPTLTSGWGTGPTTQGHTVGSAGRVTLGTTPNATTLVLDTNLGASAAGAICFFQNESTPALLKNTRATGTITITGTFVAGNVISWLCYDIRGQ